ncbi:hypothetical protein E2C01_022529 [Portunus trituberculatus]|uniref:Uncharacterized protein n=1 Tax=Portunus trituberculatus TaxID=210409 RepID=A0A5B7E856_PORTR|nr:hypothetical protein [Portunus trituberculatus]
MYSFFLTKSNIFSIPGHHIFKAYSVTSQCKKTNMLVLFCNWFLQMLGTDFE